MGERLLLPALNLKGLKSAEVGDASRNVIPPSASASIGLRLVKGNDPQAMLDLVEAHIPPKAYPEQWDSEGLENEIERIMGERLPVQEWAKEDFSQDDDLPF